MGCITPPAALTEATRSIASGKLCLSSIGQQRPNLLDPNAKPLDTSGRLLLRSKCPTKLAIAAYFASNALNRNELLGNSEQFMHHHTAEHDRQILEAEDAAEARCRYQCVPERGIAKEGDLFRVKACDRPEYGRVGSYVGMSSGLVVLAFGSAWVSFYPEDVEPTEFSGVRKERGTA
jgi:hypothetical protein